MEALIDLFWSKYADLREAVDVDDEASMAAIERELDPLLLAVLGSEEQDPAAIQAQFRFALDLLNAEADDRGCVRRNAHLLQTLVERYLSPAASAGPRHDCSDNPDPEIIDLATATGVLDDALLNRVSDRIMLIAPGYRILYSNDTNAKRMRMAREELVGRHIAELIGLHRFRNEFEPRLQRCFEGESAAVTYAEDVDGQTIVMRCRMSPFVRSSTLVGALVVIQETADRRRRSAA